CFFLFFLAEVGIRDFHVTGVQTCALPIFKNELTGIKISSAVLGVVVVLLSLLIPLIPGNVIEVTVKTNGLFIAPLFNLFFMALFLKNPKPFGVVRGSIYGFFAGFMFAFWVVLSTN